MAFLYTTCGMTGNEFDVIFAGGGLAATLAAYRLRQTRPDLRLLIVEAGQTLGGNKTWSFHDTDLDGAAREWVRPFVVQSWPKQIVRFPRYVRTLSIGYNTISSDLLHEAAAKALGDAVLFDARVSGLTPTAVTLEDGRTFSAPCVIDARGQGNDLRRHITIAYQKFFGIEVEVSAPHGQTYPIIMDATVPQQDGYRFVYTLPFSANRILIEDTYYSDTPAFDIDFLRNECLRYAENRGWAVARIVREEQGVLPIVLAGDVDAVLAQGGNIPSLGLRGGFFHHTTSYSFPFAVRYADAMAAFHPLESTALAKAMAGWARSHWRNQSFFRLLNRMLFWAATPDSRYSVLERFYGLREPLISRFYNSGLTYADQARILIGKPPVPIGRAIRVLMETESNPIPSAAA